jgi:hypothetical protein
VRRRELHHSRSCPSSDGPIFVLEAFGAKTFVVSSAEAQKEIFENRGANYSSRYELPMHADWVTSWVD